jgi:hypothetical protein
MHIILKAHSTYIAEQQTDDSHLSDLMAFDQVHALFDFQMIKYLGSDEEKEQLKKDLGEDEE